MIRAYICKCKGKGSVKRQEISVAREAAGYVDKAFVLTEQAALILDYEKVLDN